MDKTITLGAEYDEVVFSALKEILKAEKAKLIDSSWGVGGSQEVSTWKYLVGGEECEIVAETYVGEQSDEG